MRFKRFLYSVLLLLFVLVLIADLGLWFLVPDAQDAAAFEAGSLPEGMSLPEGVTLPEGMTFPSDDSLPEGMTFPDLGEGRDGSKRPSRPGRTGSDEETTALTETEESTQTAAWRAWLSDKWASLRAWFSARVEELREYLPLSELTPVKEKTAPYRLFILIGAALGMALCIVRLVFINRKIRQQEEANDALSSRRVALWPAFLLLLGALVLVVVLFPVNEEEEPEDGAVADTRLITGTVEKKDLTSLIQSTGYLEEQETVGVEIPASVSIASVCVKNGDTVTAGQILAKVDQVSLMKAISNLHDALDQIDAQLQKAHEIKGDTTLKAPMGGIVKAVYAVPGRKAMDVMSEYGALMLLSLDGRMAVQVPAADGLVIDTAVTVTMPDGAELDGEVTFLQEGVATVTMVDRGYAIGTEVSVKDGEGNLLGSGALYVNKALNITGYLGTVTYIYCKEGSKVEADASLLGLNDTANLAEFSVLLEQRSEYEDELMDLFQLYQDNYIHAPCDGVIDGLSDEYTYTTLSNMVTGLTVKQLANSPADAEPAEFVHVLAEVDTKVGNRVHLIKGGEVSINSFSSLPTPSGQGERDYTFGSVTIWIYSGGWNRANVNEIQIGDKVLFTFDPNQNYEMVWIIVQHTSTGTPDPDATPDPSGTPDPDATPGPSGTPDPNATPNPSGSPGPGGGWGGGHFSFGGRGGGSASATQKPAYTIAKQELCTVTPQERMLITVSIDELDILALSLGQEADLYLDALPSMGLTATVTEIDPEGENEGGNTKYSVTLALDRGEQLYPGMNGTVCFPRSEKQGVLTVPLAALTEEGPRTLIYTAYDEETDELLSPVEVQTGISDGTDVEILSGLSLGDTYYYRYADTISYVTDS